MIRPEDPEVFLKRVNGSEYTAFLIRDLWNSTELRKDCFRDFPDETTVQDALHAIQYAIDNDYYDIDSMDILLRFLIKKFDLDYMLTDTLYYKRGGIDD